MALGWLWWRAWAGADGVDAAAFCVAGVALGDMDWHFAWQAWQLVTWIVTLRGRRGAYGTGLALVARLGRSGRGGRRGFLRGRRGTWRHRLALCVAGVALGDMDRHFAWQVWHLWHWAGSGAVLGPEWTIHVIKCHACHAKCKSMSPSATPATQKAAASTLRGRRGTYGTGLALVARLGPS